VYRPSGQELDLDEPKAGVSEDGPHVGDGQSGDEGAVEVVEAQADAGEAGVGGGAAAVGEAVAGWLAEACAGQREEACHQVNAHQRGLVSNGQRRRSRRRRQFGRSDQQPTLPSS
jgi:hypothetical protein